MVIAQSSSLLGTGGEARSSRAWFVVCEVCEVCEVCGVCEVCEADSCGGAPGDAARLRWPERPGWWHPDAQPLGRPCFRRDAASGEVRLVRDRRTLVLARRLLAGGKRRGVRDDNFLRLSS